VDFFFFFFLGVIDVVAFIDTAVLFKCVVFVVG
jgi:hypothetical protein